MATPRALTTFCWRDLPAAASALVPAVWAASHGANVPGAAFDGDATRVVGMASAGFPGRALDVLLAAPLQLLPVGTKAYRAALVAALALGLFGWALQRLGARLLRGASPGAPAASWLAAVGSLATTLSLPAQVEGSGPGGHTVGALLAVVPLWLWAEHQAAAERGAGSPTTAAFRIAWAVSAALVYDPRVGLAGGGALLVADALAGFPLLARGAATIGAGRLGFAVALGAAPAVVLALASWLAPAPWPPQPTLPWETEATSRVVPLLWELGPLLLATTGLGAAAAFVAPRARALAGGLAVLVVAGLLAPFLREPVGRARFGPALLAGYGPALVGAACALHTFSGMAVRARLSHGRATATLLVMLFAALPLRTLDDTALSLGRRAAGTVAVWDLLAWMGEGRGAVVLALDPRVVTRLSAARALGAFRPDLLVVPTAHLTPRTARELIAQEPNLAPLLRELLLTGAPTQGALAAAAAARPVAVSYDPRWERELARHLVPGGLLDRYEASAMAPSDRAPLLELQGRALDRLVRSTTAVHEGELRRLTVSLLRRRLAGLMAAGDRDNAGRVVGDLRRIEPSDAFALEVERRLAAKRSGALDERDLGPLLVR